MKVIGLDLSLSASGIAVPQGVTTIKAPKGSMGMDRLGYVRDVVMGAVGALSPDLIVIEGYSMGTARQSSHAHGLGELGGVIRLALYEGGFAYVDCPPACLKKYATGKGNANKEAVLIAAVKRGAPVSDNNQADAWWLRAMGMDALGEPVVDVLKLNRTALSTIAWPGNLASTR